MWFFKQLVEKFLKDYEHSFFGKVERIVDWEKVRKVLKRKRGRGGPRPYDEVMMVKILLIQQWYGISDEEMEQNLRKNLEMMTFVGTFGQRDISIPDATTICRFRLYVVENGLWKRVFKVVNESLRENGLKVKSGRVAVDATLVESAARPRKCVIEGGEVEYSKDKDSRWVVKRGSPRYGYKCYARVDEQGFVERVHVTPANEAECKQFESMVEGVEEGVMVVADKGYDSRENRQLLQARGLRDGIQRREFKGRGGQRERNKRLSKFRFVVERMFGTLKRRFGFVRAWYLGIQKVLYQFCFKAMCVNLLKAANMCRC